MNKEARSWNPSLTMATYYVFGVIAQLFIKNKHSGDNILFSIAVVIGLYFSADILMGILKNVPSKNLLSLEHVLRLCYWIVGSLITLVLVSSQMNIVIDCAVVVLGFLIPQYFTLRVLDRRYR